MKPAILESDQQKKTHTKYAGKKNALLLSSCWELAIYVPDEHKQNIDTK